MCPQKRRERPTSRCLCMSAGNIEHYGGDSRMKHRVLLIVFLLFSCSRISGIAAESGVSLPAESLQLASIPGRPHNADSGSEFALKANGLSGREQQRAALIELRQGNIPEFLRTLKPVELSYTPPGGKTMAAIIWVTPDYLAIGSETDFLRMPLTYPSATVIAREFDCILPTRKMVDAIYAQAAYHLKPQPLPPGPQMVSIGYFLKHQQQIETQRAREPLGELIAGHKKDVVLTNLLRSHPGRIAIYGWHQLNGRPIQPLSTVHGARYADYSHGIRLVYQTVWIDGQPHDIFEALDDPRLAPLFTDEGIIAEPRTLLSAVVE